jgi:apolipoprotein D and lipocalin family protein
MKKEKWLIALAAGVGVAAVTYSLLPSKNIAAGATPVKPFDKYRYLGKWHEIARLPNFIEKNVNQLTEEYSLNEDGSIKVVTRAYHIKKKVWKEFWGVIKFAGAEDVGMLKVSYLRPIYANYNVLDIDDDYKYALVSGSGLGFLWILSKETTVPDDIKKRFLNTARTIGFKVNELEWA